MTLQGASRAGSARRAAGRLLLAVPLSGAALLVAAAPASAAINTPGAGTTYTADTTVGITASVPASGTQSVLTLVAPDGASRELARTTRSNQLSNYSTSLSGNLDTDCASADCSPGQVKPARNGTWTVKLTGAQSDTQTFALRIAPKAPFDVSAATTGEREITVVWKRGVEPDLAGFTLYDGSGAVLRSDIPLSACGSGTSCSTVMSYGADDSGERSFALRAHRTEAPGSSQLVDSAQSGVATSSLAAKPAPAPEPTQEPGSTGGDPGTTGGDPGTTGGDPGTTGGDPGTSTSGGGSTSTGGSTGSSTGGSSTGSSSTGGTTSGASGSVAQPGIGTGSKSDTRAIEQRRAFALTFRAFNPKLGISKLPPLPKLQAPVVGEAELEDGTFEETLGFGDREVEEKYEILGSKRIGGAVSGALDSEQFLRFIAVAMVLMLTAAHLRRWLGATATEE